MQQLGASDEADGGTPPSPPARWAQREIVDLFRFLAV
jgi:hypothetical protein